MINIHVVENRKCIKCDAVPREIFQVGVVNFCEKCKTEEFGNLKEFKPSTKNGLAFTKLGRVYHKWLGRNMAQYD